MITDMSLSFAKADEIRHQLVRPVDTGRKLAPQAQADIHPAPFAVDRLDERPALRAFVVRKRIFHFDEIAVPRVVFGQKLDAALLDPPAPRAIGDAVRRGKDGI